MKSLKYQQIEDLIISSNIDLTNITNDEIIAFCEKQKEIIPSSIYDTLIQVMLDLNKKYTNV